jgi:hypothetical protein
MHMKKTALGLVLATFAGAAAAGDLAEPRNYESNDYSAQVFYRVDFGGERGYGQSLGLRFDNERAHAAGAPAMFQARFGEQGLDKLAVNGVDLRGAMLASNQSGGGMFANLSVGQWIAIGYTALLFGVVATDALDEDAASTGTGGS